MEPVERLCDRLARLHQLLCNAPGSTAPGQSKVKAELLQGHGDARKEGADLDWCRAHGFEEDASQAAQLEEAGTSSSSNSMSDVFAEPLKFSEIAEIWAVMALPNSTPTKF